MIGPFFYLDKEGNFIYEDVPMRKCSDKEWARFHPPNKDSKKYLDYIKSRSPDRAEYKDAFLCMDLNSSNSVIRPNYYSGLTIAYLPCDKVADYEVTEGSYEIDDKCEPDETKRAAYLMEDLDKWDYYQTFLYYNY